MAYNQDNVWSEDVPTNNTQQQPQQAPAPAPQNSNGWDSNAFKQVVGRDPDQKETDYYSNAGSGWLDEVKRNTPGYSAPAPQQAPTTTGGGQPPSYYNASDPVHQAVWQAYQAKGIQPRDASDFNYWVQHINDSGGLANGYQSTGGTGTWADRMASANGGVGDYRTGGAPIAGGTRGGGGFYSPGQRDPRLDSLYDELVKRSQQSLEVNPNDPVLKAQTTAFRNAQTRGLRSNLAQTAEAAGPNANLSAETRAAGETAAQNTAGFQAELQGREVDARRKEIADALAGRMGMLSMDQQAQLRREDMALQSRQIDLQGQRDENDAANAAWDRQYKTLFGA